MKKDLVERILHNILVDFLNEGRNAEKAKQNTYNVIKNYFKNASWLNDIFNDQAANPNRLRVIEYIEETFRRDFFGTNVSDSVIRLEPIMMNVALGLGFEQNEADGEKLNRLKSIIQYIKINNNKEGFPIQLNKLTIDNTSYEGLNELFGEIIDNEIAKDNETANQYDSNSKMNPNYEVIEIHNQDEAHEYGKYSCSRSILCFTEHSNMWEKFTNRGLNRVYLILNKNWKNIPEEFGENNPYDEYGLSMIFLFINPDGNIAYSNTRWNHGTREHVNNVDNSFTKSDISKLLGVNFDSVFKPYSDDELLKMGYISIKRLRELFSKGKKPSDIFDNYSNLSNDLLICKKNHKYILYNLKTKQIPETLNDWLDGVSRLKDGLALVALNGGKWSFIFPDGNLIGNGKLLFDNAYDFHDGFANVKLNGKWSFIDTDGKLIGNGKLWFDNVRNFYKGFAPVLAYRKWSFIDTDGNLIGNGNLWFDDINDFKNGFAEVKLNNKYSLINIYGKLIGDGKLWFDNIYDAKYGFAKVKLNDKYSFIDSDGKLVGNGKLWFDYAYDFQNGFAKVELNNKCSFIDTDGKLIGNGNLWFDVVEHFEDGFAKVKLNNKYSFIDSECRLIGKGKLWFDNVSDFEYGFAHVMNNEKWSLIDSNGKLIGNGTYWFDLITRLINGFYWVFSSDKTKWSVINKKEELFDNGKTWFDRIIGHHENQLEVEISGKKYIIDTDFNLYDYETKQPIKAPLNNESIDRIGRILRECIDNYLSRKY